MASDAHRLRQEVDLSTLERRRLLQEIKLDQAELYVLLHRAKLQILEYELQRARAAAGR
jgi:hypothetical protein